MKLLSSFLLLIATGTLAFGHNVQSGPNGGRLITTVTPHAVSPANQVVKVTTGQRSAPTTLTFSAKDGVLLSEGEVPTGNKFPTVVQIKPTPDAKTVVERFYLNTIVCSGCDNPEYACTCGH